MYSNTRFNALMKVFPRSLFNRLVKNHGTDKHNKGFRSWDQFIAMIFGQLAGCRSLRDLTLAFNARAGHHYHLGTRTIKRSTLADANRKRDGGLYQALCQRLLQGTHRKIKRDVDQLLYLLDSTPISLKGHGYDEWTRGNRSARTQGLKLHMLYAPGAQAPVYGQITAPNVNDIEDAKRLTIEPDATYVFDKGYYDYNWWHTLDQAGAVFVSRFKINAGLEKHHTLSAPQGTVLADEQVTFKHGWPSSGRINHYKKPLRRIAIARPSKSPLVLATNDFTRTANEIAALYKARWQIELFFKWLKQNLKIKQFLGRSENAVKTQIYIALITYLLIWSHRTQQHTAMSLKHCKVLLATALFQRPNTDYQLWKRRRQEKQALLERQGVLL